MRHTTPPDAGPPRPRPPRRSVRWWPAILIVALTGIWLVAVWQRPDAQRQDRVVGTLTAAALAGLLLFVWFMVLSRLRWRVRLIGLGAALLGLIAAASMLRVGGFSGDVVPILEWRWSAAGERAPIADASPPTTTPPAAAAPSATDYPQFLGPERDGSVPGVTLADDWAAAPPRQLWRQAIGAGWSAFAVAGPYAVTQEQRGDEEWVSAYELETGRLLWSHRDRVRFEDPLGGPGPRATPTIDRGRVYAVGATGRLNVLDLVTGAAAWSVDVVGDNGAAVPTYGFSASPLVTEDQVIVAAGGPGGRALVSYDAGSGARRWSGGDGGAAYSSPLRAELAGMAQVLTFNDTYLGGHDPANGRLLWSWPWPPETQKVSQPVVLPGDRVFLSSGYGVGGKLLALARADTGEPSVTLVWESTGLKAKFTNVVYHDGFLYGLDDGILVCLDPRDGQRRWKGGRYGHGQILRVGEHLLVMGERGEVALVEARPEAYRERARLGLLEGKTWNHPALAGSRLLVRNDREAACFELPLADLGRPSDDLASRGANGEK